MDDQSADNLHKKIDAYLRGDLSQEEVEELWVELLKNPEYIDELQTEIDIARLYEQKKQASRKSSRFAYGKWLAAAAAVALLVISINYFNRDVQKPLEEWTTSQIILSENLASSPVTRSASNIATQDSLLNAGFKAAIEGDEERASKIYQSIIERYDTVVVVSKAHLNLGILKYNAGDFEKSIDNFRKALATERDNPMVEEQASWFISNALINTKQLKEAREHLQGIYTSGQIYSEEAYKLLKRLDYEMDNINYDDSHNQN